VSAHPITRASLEDGGLRRQEVRELEMNYRKEFLVKPGEEVRLRKIDPACTGKHGSHEEAAPKIQKNLERLTRLQYLLYADGRQSLLVVLQALDAGGKDGVVRHVFNAMNPQGTSVFGFKQPSKSEAAHDFLWRAHQRTPGKGEVVIFNRSHYEDVLVVRVHELVPKSVWFKRYELINGFEKMLHENGTSIVKLYLHVSPEEQLSRFHERLEDPGRQWKIRETDYSERELWPAYIDAFEEAMERTSTKHAPWYVVPSNHKWFRDLAISQIIADTLDDMGLKLPPPQVDIAAIRRKYHMAEVRLEGRTARAARHSRGRAR
jgi:PPK2 family polyphosphate:nucleotide phosphotransferase